MNIRRPVRLLAIIAGLGAAWAGDVIGDLTTGTTQFSNTAEAQGRGGRGGGPRGMGGMREIRELLAAEVTRRDMPLFVDELELDDGQEAIVESLVVDYEDTFGDGSEAVQADLMDLGRSMMQSFMGGGAMGDMRERARERAQEVQAELAEMEANGEPLSEEERREFWRSRMTDMQSEMMDEAMESGAFDEARGVLTEMLDILEDWIAERKALRATFVSNLEAQLSDDQLVLWPAFERYLVREKSLPRGRLSGEGVNLFTIVDELEFDEASFELLEDLLDEYEMAIHQALVVRDEYLLTSAPKLFKAMRDGDVDDAERVMQQQLRYREVVRDVNDRFRDRLVEALTVEEDKSLLQETVLAEAYDRIYRTTWGERAFDAVLEDMELTPETLENVLNLQMAFLEQLAARNQSLVFKLRETEAERQVEEGTRMVAVMSGDLSRGMPWGGGRSRGGEEDPYREGMEARNEMEEGFVEQLRSLLTPEQQEALPSRRGRGGWGGGGRGGRGGDEGRREEMIKRFDADGDGELSESERQEMFRSFRSGGGGAEGGERGGRGRGGREGGRGGRGGEGGRGQGG